MSPALIESHQHVKHPASITESIGSPDDPHDDASTPNSCSGLDCAGLRCVSCFSTLGFDLNASLEDQSDAVWADGSQSQFPF